MSFFDVVAILITLAAAFSYLNYRVIGLPTTIGIMLIALVMSLALIGLHQLGVGLDTAAAELLGSVDFNKAVLGGMLAFLLFAGALHVNLSDLWDEKTVVALLSTASVVLSTLIIAALTWMVLALIGLRVPLVYCALFGALISPTDPIAVLGILKSAGVPRDLEMRITGESLFNDGIGVVVFIVVLEMSTGARPLSLGSVVLLFGREAAGGAALGLVSGVLAYLMLKSVDNYQVEVLITLALVMGTYAAAGGLHLSGPIAMVIAGLLIGNRGRQFAMSETTRQHLDTFWELVDEILNAVLFVLIGLEVLVLPFTPQYLIAGAAAIPIVLLARYVSVSIPVRLLSLGRHFGPKTVRILTWAGLRGGISVALALSLPRGPHREVLVAITYSVVLFSIVVQGLSIGWVIRRSGLSVPPPPPLAPPPVSS